MSRSWERKVQKNRAQLNRQRKKQGHSGFTKNGIVVSGDTYKGRKFVFPIVLILLAILYGLLGWASSTLPDQENQSSPMMTWFVVAAYIVLGVIIYLRRPYLLVNKDNLQTTKLNRVRTISASEIARIKVKSGSVVIEPKAKGSNWVFTRLINRYDIKAMGERLEQFAKANNIHFEK
ncbi:hypothetical protein [Paenibacillus crassostreae]|uniref:Methyltransferase n=1 Tax=Paenibacillus crassostreae TaxID=1763538 RepID=A0A167DS48_9BACL|nr:hypothetical protein [Paenibacillus crassostreae]AOZ91122.1 hypothetical protein LPB68_02140 [Paenibacillus crassostreae]OAB74718.1 hypothetical protein PNBC_11815 [Paenibacillus crassostreae]